MSERYKDSEWQAHHFDDEKYSISLCCARPSPRSRPIIQK